MAKSDSMFVLPVALRSRPMAVTVIVVGMLFLALALFAWIGRAIQGEFFTFGSFSPLMVFFVGLWATVTGSRTVRGLRGSR